MLGKILVVEDYDDTRFIIKFMLEQLGHQVLEATDGQEAVDLALQELPDLILMDIALPTMDGLTATRIIKQKDETANVPVVCVTAQGREYQEKGVAAGCDMVMNKPVNISDLASVVARYF